MPIEKQLFRSVLGNFAAGVTVITTVGPDGTPYGLTATAFGANLLGAMVGGILEYMALITGYRALLLLVALLYGLALLFGRRHLTEEPDADGAVLETSAAQPVPAS